MRQVGLILAPEIVKRDVSAFSLGAKELSILQRRVSFIELGMSELTEHNNILSPISLSFDIAKLRNAGATPVIYVPQHTASPLSQIATFCVHGVFHTKYVLSELQKLKEVSDPVQLAQQLKMPVSAACEITLSNTDSRGDVVAQYNVPMFVLREVVQYVGFNSIPFDHSAGILGFFLDMFYPTDNTYTNDQLGYYPQREWCLQRAGWESVLAGCAYKVG